MAASIFGILNRNLAELKKIFAISFLIIYLFSTTELRQLLKMPLLVERFIEHRKESKDLNLWQFLYIHYAYGDLPDADYEKDMKLPFKSHDNYVSSISNSYISILENISVTKPLLFSEKKTFSAKDPFLLYTFLSNIWQPPKTC